MPGLALIACVACSSGNDTPLDDPPAPRIDIALSGLNQPRDATADLDAGRVHTIAGGNGAWELINVPLEGGTTKILASLIDPRNLVLADDGDRVYIAERYAVFVVPFTGGTPVRVPGTEGYQPVRLDYDASTGKGVLVFAG